ncbi:monocarboxylate transporter 12-like isoform X2 [Patiria miniata]|uniref:Major facilitator superfamily (MFS) profile domain-containing protein n=1 Tax=Patiria miniata TaxID=46514 RepID=A0A913YZX6_PATMI|nr:monocarboxylate transporter 12-like isoform X2 [Patiria miniata]
MDFDTTGCFLVLLSFTINFMWGCVFKSLGVLLPTLTEQFTTHTWIIGTIASITAATADIGGPSMGIITLLVNVLQARHFQRRYTLACGIGHVGNAVAFLAFAPMTQLFLDTYGWRGAALLIAGISMHQIASAAVVRVTKAQYEPLTDSLDNHQDDTDKEGCSSRGKKSCLHLLKAIDLGILTEFKFWIAFMCRFGVTCAFDSWMLYYVPHLEVKGFPPLVAAALCSAAAVGYFLGAIVWAPFIDRDMVKCSTAIIISSLFLTLSFVVDPWVTDIPSCVFVTFVCGLFASAVYTLVDVLVKDIFEMDRLVSAFAWVKFFLFVPRLFGGFVPGWVYDTRGSYDLAFIVIGLVPTICLVPLIIGILRKTTKGL